VHLRNVEDAGDLALRLILEEPQVHEKSLTRWQARKGSVQRKPVLDLLKLEVVPPEVIEQAGIFAGIISIKLAVDG